jgi:3-deoxy-D-manno-octulosonic acid kinase
MLVEKKKPQFHKRFKHLLLGQVKIFILYTIFLFKEHSGLKSMMRIKTYDSYQLGSSIDLTQNQIQQLISRFKSPDAVPEAILGGRGAATRTTIDGIGAVVVKQYTRGGWLRKVVKSKYLKCGKTRGQLEYEFLQIVRNLGINAPAPLVWASRGHLVYSAWLVTRHIFPSQSLIQLSLENEDLAGRAMRSTVDQILRLIQNKILHVDLHPGNVIVDPEGRVFLLDFDKGQIYHGSKQQLHDRYYTRWKRAVVKHQLPVMLIDLMRAGLKEIYH